MDRLAVWRNLSEVDCDIPLHQPLNPASFTFEKKCVVHMENPLKMPEPAPRGTLCPMGRVGFNLDRIKPI